MFLPMPLLSAMSQVLPEAVMADAAAYAGAEGAVLAELRAGASPADAYRHKADLVAALRARRRSPAPDRTPPHV